MMGLWIEREGKEIGRFEVEDCMYGLQIEYTMCYVI